jgi:multiple sugar transport system substrate-binding protein
VGQKRPHIWVKGERHQRPVVKAGSAQLAVVDQKPQRFDQVQFAAGGGQSAIKSVYEDPKYVGYRPWNRAWATQLDWQKDVWHVAPFFDLLTQQQDQFDLAITGKQDAKTTLDNVAKYQENLLKEAGLIK